MLVLDGKTDLNQISLTGVRALALIGLLIIAPRSLEEIRKSFINMHIMDNNHSDDILRIDLNNSLYPFSSLLLVRANKPGYLL